MAGLASAWAMARRRPYLKGYGHDGLGDCLGDGQTEAYLKDMDMTDLLSAWTRVTSRTASLHTAMIVVIISSYIAYNNLT